MENRISEQELLQNLKDAGCSPEERERFLVLEGTGNISGQLALLSLRRRKLLERVHQEEKRITCLDYLVYRLEQKK